MPSKFIERERERLHLPWLYDYAWGVPYGEPIGFAEEGDIYCVDCAKDRGIETETHEGVMFQSEEVDSPVTCGGCGLLLPSSLTGDGADYVKSVDGRTRWGKLLREVYDWVFC